MFNSKLLVYQRIRGNPKGSRLFSDQGAIQNVRPTQLSKQVQAKAGGTTKEEWSLQESPQGCHVFVAGYNCDVPTSISNTKD